MVTDNAELFSDGAAYERLMGRWSRLAGEQFLDWLGAAPGLDWLDVGCGNGAFTEVLIARCAPAAVTGIDPSAGQLAYARNRPGAKLAQFRIGEAQDLPFDADSFDAAAMALAICFVPDAHRAVAEMARVVRQGGLVATYMWDFPNGGFPLRPLGGAMKSLGLTPPSTPNPTASLRETMQTIWAEIGLAEIETCVIRVPIVYADFDDFWQSATVPSAPSGRAVGALSRTARDQLKARLRERLPAGPDGRIAYEAFANAVKGRVVR